MNKIRILNHEEPSTFDTLNYGDIFSVDKKGERLFVRTPVIEGTKGCNAMRLNAENSSNVSDVCSFFYDEDEIYPAIEVVVKL